MFSIRSAQSFFCVHQGLAILIPLIEQIKYVQSLKEVATEVPSQSAITLGKIRKHSQFVATNTSYQSLVPC
jgi:uncharacterized membrane protein YqiK